jgi:hypothetical protein
MARQLRDNQDLAHFVIEGEANGRQLGTGSYGSVEEVSSNNITIRSHGSGQRNMAMMIWL